MDVRVLKFEEKYHQKKKLYTKQMQRRRAGKIALLGQSVQFILTPHCLFSLTFDKQMNRIFLRTSAHCVLDAT